MRLSLGTSPVRGVEAMHALGEAIAGKLRGGDVLALCGDLGAGKTTLVRGICAGLGVEPDAVSSPTFALCHVYEGRDWHVAHLDLYRLESAEDLSGTGLDEWLAAPDAICLIEWPEIARAELPATAIWLDVTLQDDGRLVSERLAPAAASR